MNIPLFPENANELLQSGDLNHFLTAMMPAIEQRTEYYSQKYRVDHDDLLSEISEKMYRVFQKGNVRSIPAMFVTISYQSAYRLMNRKKSPLTKVDIPLETLGEEQQATGIQDDLKAIYQSADLEQNERDFLQRLIEINFGNRQVIAEELGVSVKFVSNKLIKIIRKIRTNLGLHNNEKISLYEKITESEKQVRKQYRRVEYKSKCKVVVDAKPEATPKEKPKISSQELAERYYYDKSTENLNEICKYYLPLIATNAAKFSAQHNSDYDDIISDMCKRLMDAMPAYDPAKGKIDCFLTTVFNFGKLQLIRKYKKHKRHLEYSETPDDDGNMPNVKPTEDHKAEAERDLSEIINASKLTELQKKVIDCMLSVNLSYRKAATELGLNYKQVDNTYRLALLKMRKTSIKQLKVKR